MILHFCVDGIASSDAYMFHYFVPFQPELLSCMATPYTDVAM